MKVCSTSDCNKKVHGRGMCSACLFHWRKSNSAVELREALVCADCEGIFAASPRGTVPTVCQVCAKERYRAMQIRSQKRNPGTRRTSEAKRRATKKNAPVVQELDLCLIYDVFNGCCYLCGIDVEFDNWHLEHIQPLSKGGSHSYANTAVSCGPCNNKKYNFLLIEVVNSVG